MLRRTFLTSVGSSACVLWTAALHAGHIYRTRNRCCLPHGNYGHDVERVGDDAIAVANVARDVTWLQSEAGLVNGAFQEVTRERPGKLITFHVRAAGITAEPVQLDQIGLNLYSTGQLVTSGRLTYLDDPDDGSVGHNVTFRMWAFTAFPRGREGLADPLVDTPAVWSSTKNYWASRGRPRMIRLTPPGKDVYPDLQKHFHQITHMKVEMEYRRDR